MGNTHNAGRQQHDLTSMVVDGQLTIRAISQQELEQVCTQIISNNYGITALCLSGCVVYEAGAISIGRLLVNKDTAMQMLNIAGTQIGTRGARHLATALSLNRSLLFLCLSGNFIDDQGIAVLLNSLLSNTVLLHLDISRNPITDTGSQILSNFICLNEALTSFNLSQIALSDDGIKEISSALSRNRTFLSLDLSRNDFHSSELLMNCVNAQNSLIQLNLSGNPFEERGLRTILQCLVANSTICILSLRATNMTDNNSRDLSEFLVKNRRVSYLDIGANRLTVAGIQQISEALVNTSVVVLNLSDNRILDSGAICISEVLNRRSNPIHINLNGNGISNVGMNSLIPVLNLNKKSISVSCNNISTVKSQKFTLNCPIKVNGEALPTFSFSETLLQATVNTLSSIGQQSIEVVCTENTPDLRPDSPEPIQNTEPPVKPEIANSANTANNTNNTSSTNNTNSPISNYEDPQSSVISNSSVEKTNTPTTLTSSSTVTKQSFNFVVEFRGVKRKLLHTEPVTPTTCYKTVILEQACILHGISVSPTTFIEWYDTDTNEWVELLDQYISHMLAQPTLPLLRLCVSSPPSLSVTNCASF
ncbi:NOD3 protein [Pelomyxa schiedti]|nr:NOD3 protein [Pelomyxa schiedti]